MFGFLTRLFGGKSTVIKDPDIGKVRYLESDHGHVWAGTLRLRSVAGEVSSSASSSSERSEAANVQFFIDSKEMVLRHESKNAILDVLDNYNDHVAEIEQRMIHEQPMLAGNDFVLHFLHIPEPEASYDAEFICQSGERSFSAIFNEMKLQELILHED